MSLDFILSFELSAVLFHWYFIMKVYKVRVSRVLTSTGSGSTERLSACSWQPASVGCSAGDFAALLNEWLYVLCTLSNKGKVKYTSICIAHFYANRLKCTQTWITQFYLQITPCLPLLPSRRTSPPFGWYSFYRPTESRRLSRPGKLFILGLLFGLVVSSSVSVSVRRIWLGLPYHNWWHVWL